MCIRSQKSWWDGHHPYTIFWPWHDMAFCMKLQRTQLGLHIFICVQLLSFNPQPFFGFVWSLGLACKNMIRLVLRSSNKLVLALQSMTDVLQDFASPGSGWTGELSKVFLQHLVLSHFLHLPFISPCAQSTLFYPGFPNRLMLGDSIKGGSKEMLSFRILHNFSAERISS